METTESTLIQIPGYFITREIWEQIKTKWGGEMTMVEFFKPFIADANMLDWEPNQEELDGIDNPFKIRKK
jgi:hypothetical protein